MPRICVIIYDVYNIKCVKANRDAVMRTRNVLRATPHDVQQCSIWFAMWLMISNQMIPEAFHLKSPSRHEYRRLYAERVLNRFYGRLNRWCYHVKVLKQSHDHSPICQQSSALHKPMLAELELSTIVLLRCMRLTAVLC